MIIFISPAKTFRKTNQKSDQIPIFQADTKKLVKQLKTLDIKHLKSSMNISDKVAVLTHQYYQHFGHDMQPAILSYYGHQFKHIDVDAFSLKDLQYMNQHLYIMSGLYGLLKPLDQISFYRLEMQDKTITNLYDFWTPKIKKYIDTYHKGEIFINLASKEYGQIIENLNHTYTIEFYQLKNDKPYIHSMEAKRLRGLFTNHLIMYKIKSLDEIKNISIDNYTFNEKLSNNKLMLFTKEI